MLEVCSEKCLPQEEVVMLLKRRRMQLVAAIAELVVAQRLLVAQRLQRVFERVFQPVFAAVQGFRLASADELELIVPRQVAYRSGECVSGDV